MPYKDPERKRQGEREHREQRNARCRGQQFANRMGANGSKARRAIFCLRSRLNLDLSPLILDKISSCRTTTKNRLFLNSYFSGEVPIDAVFLCMRVIPRKTPSATAQAIPDTHIAVIMLPPQDELVRLSQKAQRSGGMARWCSSWLALSVHCKETIHA